MIEEASMKRMSPRFFSIPPEAKDGLFSLSATSPWPQARDADSKG
jgi:hypothetical protein